MPTDTRAIAPQVREFVDRQPILALATSAPDGTPNVAPMFWKVWFDTDTLLILDNYMRTSSANILATGTASVAAWDSASGMAYQLKGTAHYVTEGPYYQAGAAQMAAKKPGEHPKGVVVLHVRAAYIQQPGPLAGRLVDAQGEVCS
jgi:predicted pyridoxine 5'-phosphate oxidase superfamily flavin-nucleotide-binding protein